MGLRNNLKKNYINTMKRKNLLLENILNFFSNKILGDNTMIKFTITSENFTSLEQYDREEAQRIVNFIIQNVTPENLHRHQEELLANLKILASKPKTKGKTIEDINRHLEEQGEINPYRRGESIHQIYPSSMFFVTTTSDCFIARYPYGIDSLYNMIVEDDIDTMRSYGIPLQLQEE